MKLLTNIYLTLMTQESNWINFIRADMSNQDYQAIMLAFNEDVEKQKEKIVDDEEEDGNVDAWLNDEYVLEMDEVLARFIREYITIMSSNTKTLTPTEVYDAVMDVHKAQLKAFHLFGKALEVKMSGHEDKVKKLVNEKMDNLMPSQVEIKNNFHKFTEQMKRMDLASIEKEWPT